MGVCNLLIKSVRGLIVTIVLKRYYVLCLITLCTNILKKTGALL
jgi:hypothetical protein